MLLPCLHNVPGTPRWGVFNLRKVAPVVSSTFGFPPFLFVVDSDGFLHVVYVLNFNSFGILGTVGVEVQLPQFKGKAFFLFGRTAKSC